MWHNVRIRATGIFVTCNTKTNFTNDLKIHL